MATLVIILLIIIILYYSTSSINDKSSRTSLPTSTYPHINTISNNNKKDQSKEEYYNWVKTEIRNLDNRQSIDELLKVMPLNEVNYSHLLKCYEWHFKRMKILIRDKFTCMDCSTKDLKNHVHHKYYVKNKLPWDIDSNALVTLCRKCHKKRHEKEKIGIYSVYNGVKFPTDINDIYCKRCGGAGVFEEYKHIEDGICFRCRGACFEKTIFADALNEHLKKRSTFMFRSIYKTFISNISFEEYLTLIKPIQIEWPETGEIKEPLDDLPF